MRDWIMNKFAGICAVLLVSASGGSACATQDGEARVTGSLPASEFPIVETAFRDFFQEREDFGCFEIFVSRSEQGIHVMFLRAEERGNQSEQAESTGAERAQICGPGARYDFGPDGHLIGKTYIRPHR
jgi:hypothetical protein